jgi:DNA-binding CsgD family transcriptional regulator/PAS domain-containing protein
MPTTDQLSGTLEKIYAAAADPALWEEVLSAIADFGDSAGAVLHIMPKVDGAAIRSYLGAGAREAYAPDNVELWLRDYAALCPRLMAGARWPDRDFIVDQMILSEAEMDRDPVYQWYGEHGLRYFVGSMLPEMDTMRAAWSLQRTRAEGHAQQPQIEAFLIIKRHLSHALQLAAKLGTLEQQCRFGMRLLDALPYAVFALDGSGRIVFMNTLADHLVEHGDGLLAEGTHLACRLPGQQPLLDRLVATALVADPGSVRGGWVRIHRASGRRPYLALVSHLAGGEELIDEFRPRLLVIVTDPDRSTVPDEQALRDLYGLTEAEARVAAQLAAGHSVQSAAAVLRQSPETLRFHLKHIFRKLGVSRQQDLVRILTEIGLVAREAPSEANGAPPERGIGESLNAK